MRISSTVKGTGKVLANMENAIDEMRRQQIVALTRIGIKVKGDAMDNTPVEIGNLRASAYMDVDRDQLFVVIGFGAEYAVYVHENMEQTLKGQPRPSGNGTYWNPGGPKFLERAVNSNHKFILDELARAHP
jgi:hypothetical protein